MSEINESSDPQLRLRMIPYNARVLDARKAKGFTHRELSLLVGKSPSLISLIETLRIIPNPELMADLSSALEAPVEYLFPQELLDAMKEGLFDKRVVELQDAHIVTMLSASKHALEEHKPIGLPTAEQVSGDLSDYDPLIKETIKNIIGDCCTEREKGILTMLFGLDGGGSHSREEVGKEFNVTRERIRQIEFKALRKFRHPSRSRKLQDREFEIEGG